MRRNRDKQEMNKLNGSRRLGRTAQILGLVIFTGIFVLGNVLCAHGMFGKIEDRLLTETGTMHLTAPEVFGSQDGWNGSVQSEDALSQEQLADILTYWKHGTVKVLHEPMTGQLSLEEAIRVGQERLLQYMFQQGSLPQLTQSLFLGQDGQLAVDATVAMLFFRSEEEGSMDAMIPYYGCWSVSFSNSSGRIQLIMNAVTGQVWTATFTLYADAVDELPAISQESITAFAVMAGIDEAEKGNYVLTGEDAFLYFEGSEIYAKGSCRQIDYSFGGAADYYAVDGTAASSGERTGMTSYSYELCTITEYGTTARSVAE